VLSSYYKKLPGRPYPPYYTTRGYYY